MLTMTEKDTIKALTTHYIDGAFVESHGREVMDIIKPTTGKVIVASRSETKRTRGGRSPRRKLAFVSFGRTTKEERLRYLHQLHKAVSARVDDLTAVMIEEYRGVARFARLIVETGVNAFVAAQKALIVAMRKVRWLSLPQTPISWCSWTPKIRSLHRNFTRARRSLPCLPI